MIFLLAPYFLIVQSEELLLLKSVIFTKNSMVHDLDVLSYQPTDLLGIILCSDPWMISSPKIETKLKKNMTVTYSDDDSADPNNNVTNVSEPVPTPAKKT